MIVLLYIVLSNTFVNVKSIRSRDVNIELETVIEFDKEDRQFDLRFIDEIQKFLGKVKKMLKAQNKTESRRFGDARPKFTDFLKRTIVILKTYQDDELKRFFDVLDDEFEKFHYKGATFYELIGNTHIENCIRKQMKKIKKASARKIRKYLNKISEVLNENTSDENEKDLMEFLNTVYTKDHVQKLTGFLHDIELYGYKMKASELDLTSIVRNVLKTIWDHYFNLHPKSQQQFRLLLDTYWVTYIPDPTSGLIYYEPYVTTEYQPLPDEDEKWLNKPDNIEEVHENKQSTLKKRMKIVTSGPFQDFKPSSIIQDDSWKIKISEENEETDENYYTTKKKPIKSTSPSKKVHQYKEGYENDRQNEHERQTMITDYSENSKEYVISTKKKYKIYTPSSDSKSEELVTAKNKKQRKPKHNDFTYETVDKIWNYKQTGIKIKQTTSLTPLNAITDVTKRKKHKKIEYNDFTDETLDKIWNYKQTAPTKFIDKTVDVTKKRKHKKKKTTLYFIPASAEGNHPQMPHDSKTDKNKAEKISESFEIQAHKVFMGLKEHKSATKQYDNDNDKNGHVYEGKEKNKNAFGVYEAKFNLYKKPKLKKSSAQKMNHDSLESDSAGGQESITTRVPRKQKHKIHKHKSKKQRSTPYKTMQTIWVEARTKKRGIPYFRAKTDEGTKILSEYNAVIAVGAPFRTPKETTYFRRAGNIFLPKINATMHIDAKKVLKNVKNAKKASEKHDSNDTKFNENFRRTYNDTSSEGMSIETVSKAEHVLNETARVKLEHGTSDEEYNQETINPSTAITPNVFERVSELERELEDVKKQMLDEKEHNYKKTEGKSSNEAAEKFNFVYDENKKIDNTVATGKIEGYGIPTNQNEEKIVSKMDLLNFWNGTLKSTLVSEKNIKSTTKNIQKFDTSTKNALKSETPDTEVVRPGVDQGPVFRVYSSNKLDTKKENSSEVNPEEIVKNNFKKVSKLSETTIQDLIENSNSESHILLNTCNETENITKPLTTIINNRIYDVDITTNDYAIVSEAFQRIEEEKRTILEEINKNSTIA